MRRILIVGGGFGGVKAALELDKRKKFEVTLLSDKDYFQYYPALYSTATGHDYRESWVPLAKIFRRAKRVKVVTDTAVRIVPDEKSVHCASGTHYTYDDVIFSLGIVTTYFGIEGLEKYSFGVKSHDEIVALQQHIASDLADGREDETRYVIVGAGPTGVELAGALGEYIRVLRKHFGIQKKRVSIHLVEAAPRVLPRMSERSSDRAYKRLRQLGVSVHVNSHVQKQTEKGLVIDGRTLASQTVVWTSGVANNPFYGANSEHFELNDRGRVKVDEFMRSGGHVYVIGDNTNTPYAGLAQTALHDAQFVAKHIRGKKKPYRVVAPPSVVPIGHRWALFEWRHVRFGGLLGNALRNAADIIGYHDILPLGWAIGTWRSGKQKMMMLPKELSFTPEHDTSPQK